MASSNTTEVRRSVLQRVPLSYFPGYELRSVLLEYPAGVTAPLHTHPVPGVNYIISGTVISQYEGEEPETFTTGQTFIDDANRVHKVKNGSQTEGFKVIVTYAIAVTEPNVVALPEGTAFSTKREQ